MNRRIIFLALFPLCCSAQAPTWTQLTNLPGPVTTFGAVLYAGADGYLYAAARSGAPYIISVFRRPLDNRSDWQNITGKGMPKGSGVVAGGQMPNGTFLLSTTSGKGNADIYAWNGSTSAPSWSRIKGWTGISSSWIYGVTNDSAGYTYFSPAWSGDIWRNDHPNSLNFKSIMDDFYHVTHGGGPGDTGGIYQLKVWDLGDGKGDMIWACGEGELDNINLKFNKASNTAYFTTAQGYKGNCTALAKSPTTILAFRTANGALEALNSIDIATRTVTVHPSPSTRTATSFPYNISTNEVGILHWMSGKNFMLSAFNAHRDNTWLLLSKDDGATWIDITATGAIDSTCTAANLSAGATSNDHYIFARCQNGRVIWQYGPVD